MVLPLLFIKVIALGCGGLFAGGLAMVMWALVPSWQKMLPEEWLHNQQCIGPYIDRYMPLLDAIAIVSTLLLLIFFWPNTGPVVWSATSLLGFVVVALISQLANVPMNRQIRSWSRGELPIHSLRLRQRWITWHALRTGVGIIAFVALLLAVIL